VNSFGDEWNKFSNFDKEELTKISNEYFDLLTNDIVNSNSEVLDLGGGTGRWSKCLANKVGFIEMIDPSSAIFSAKNLLADEKNVRITQAGAENIPFPDESFNFAMSLGVLHHIPDTEKALKNMVKKVKIDGHVLLYLYYKLDNRGLAYKFLFFISTIFRRIISTMPKFLKHFFCDLIAIFVYLPYIGLAKFVKFIFNGSFYKKFPLSYYIGKSFYIIRNDALDRFGTPLEKRFTKKEIETMMINNGLTNIVFSNNPPYWHCVGRRIS
jgi:ubiquinone/menaquinone biosynthesis C-methylase UbiE